MESLRNMNHYGRFWFLDPIDEQKTLPLEETETKTTAITNSALTMDYSNGAPEVYGEQGGMVGGAGRVRTVASQFCSLSECSTIDDDPERRKVIHEQQNK